MWVFSPFNLNLFKVPSGFFSVAFMKVNRIAVQKIIKNSNANLIDIVGGLAKHLSFGKVYADHVTQRFFWKVMSAKNIYSFLHFPNPLMSFEVVGGAYSGTLGTRHGPTLGFGTNTLQGTLQGALTHYQSHLMGPIHTKSSHHQSRTFSL